MENYSDRGDEDVTKLTKKGRKGRLTIPNAVEGKNERGERQFTDNTMKRRKETEVTRT